MIRFSANLGFLWADRPLLDRIDAAAAAGFKAVEMHWPYDVPADAIAARLNGRGVTLLGLNTAFGDASKGEFGLGAVTGREADFAAAIDQSLDYCRITGATSIHAMAGIAAGDGDLHTLVRNLQDASTKAEQQGITLLLEPINQKDKPGYFYSTAVDGLRVIEAVNRPNVKLMFDTYHIGLSGADVLAELERALPKIGHVQIAAVPSRAEPDEGDFDHKTFLQTLDRLGYDGWVGAEYKPRAGTDAGLGWVKTLGYSLGDEKS